MSTCAWMRESNRGMDCASEEAWIPTSNKPCEVSNCATTALELGLEGEVVGRYLERSIGKD